MLVDPKLRGHVEAVVRGDLLGVRLIFTACRVAHAAAARETGHDLPTVMLKHHGAAALVDGDVRQYVSALH